MLFRRYRQPSLQRTQTHAKAFQLKFNSDEMNERIDVTLLISSFWMRNKSYLGISSCEESVQLLHDRPSCHQQQEHAIRYRRNPFINYLLSKYCLQVL